MNLSQKLAMSDDNLHVLKSNKLYFWKKLLILVFKNKFFNFVLLFRY